MTGRDRTPRVGPDMLPAYGVCALTLLSGLLWVAMMLTHLDAPGLADVKVHFAVGNLLLGLGLSLSGTFLLARGPGRALGWLLLSGGCTSAVTEAVWVVIGVTRPGPPAGILAALLAVVCDALSVFVVYALPLWLPDERLPRPGGKALAATVALFTLIQRYDFAAVESSRFGAANPLRRGVWADLESWLLSWAGWLLEWGPILFIALPLAVMAVRWYRSPGPHPGYALLVLPYLLWLAVAYTGGYGLLPERLWPLLYIVGGVVWPVALGYVHTRNRSWYLDRAARRVLTAFLLTCGLVVVYAAGALVLSHFTLGPLAPGSLLVGSLILLLGTSLRPLARRAARLVDHWYYGERAQPYQAVRELAERLGRAVDPEDAPRLLCTTVTETVGLPGARLLVRTRDGARQLAGLGASRPDDELFPLVYRGEAVGHLYASPRSGELALDNQDREALRILADHAAPAIASLRLYQDLRSSRERVVLAREEERRRLRHDLHDGLGPALSGLRLQIDAVRAAVPPAAPAARPLRTVSEGIGQAITELRHITDGLAPAALAGGDLTQALQHLASLLGTRDLRITVDLSPCPLPPLPAALEVAVYRITAEALNNAVRHAHAGHARARVAVTPDEVTVGVTDDGGGFPAHEHEPGLGLRSMAERSEELGGRFALTSTTGGTTVEASFPTCSLPPASPRG
ncbi:sensor histidine kinase [Streptomyces albireticuli]|uniref:sensor histidine kinase n=1 Tax=Streptomyces albireticuli TaxID=1940 RepID=UPI0036795309